MVDGVVMMDGVIERLVDGGRAQMSMLTLDRLTPPTDTMRILLHMGTLLHMGITDTLRMGTTRTKNYAKAIPDPIATAKATGQPTSANHVVHANAWQQRLCRRRQAWRQESPLAIRVG